MISEVISRQILALANQGGNAEEIAASLEIEPALVNLVLSKHNVIDDRDISDDQLSMLRVRAFNLAMQDADLSVSARMTQYLIDRDKPKNVSQGSPLVAINNAIITAQKSFDALKEEYK